MADKEIGTLTQAADAAAGMALAGDETLHVVQDGNSRKATAGEVLRRLRMTLSAAFSSSSTTPALVTDGSTPWSFTAKAGRSYLVRVRANYQSGVVTTGGIMNVTLSGGAAGTFAGSQRAAVAAAAGATELSAPIAASGSSLTSTGATPINTPHFWTMDFIFNCTTDGTVEVRWGTEVNASAAQLNAGSTMLVEDIT